MRTHDIDPDLLWATVEFNVAQSAEVSAKVFVMVEKQLLLLLATVSKSAENAANTGADVDSPIVFKLGGVSSVDREGSDVHHAAIG